MMLRVIVIIVAIGIALPILAMCVGEVAFQIEQLLKSDGDECEDDA